ncbi:alpha-rhamnosidase [Bacteroidia bacterium]|nr:alpha-rhamnosidase [Bacteroidia bacterium]
MASTLSVTGLKCENLINPNAVDNTTPHFSWKVLYDGGKMQQRFYEIQVATDSTILKEGNADLWNTGKLESSSSVMVSYAGNALSSRSLCYWRVRVWNDKDEVSPWSEVARFGVGILNKKEWQGKFIGLPAGVGNTETPLLRKKFVIEGNGTAFLHVNSLGYHEVYINGMRVGDEVLVPAVSQLNKRSLTVTYDLTSYLHEGENEVVFWLGTGWYKKNAYDMSPISPTPDGARVCAQLDQMKNGQWETVISTNASWEGRETGYKDTGSWNANNFGGERVDAKLLPANLNPETLNQLTWTPVVEMELPNIEMSPQMTEQNKIQEVITPREITKLSQNIWLVDMGKNLNGWFEMKFPKLSANQTIILEYSDYLDNDVFQDMGQKDTYVSSGKENEVFCNKFNHHAFRYVKITMKATAPKLEDIKAYLIHTDYRPAASFECSDPDLNAIHNMIQYTMKCLTFAGYMVDCPHLERTGYGGDGNSSTMTLQTMYDVSQLFSNWLMGWGDVMREGGSLPYVAPNPGGGGGGPYWCAFIILAPWRTYVNYNDDRLIQKYYPAMKQWLEYVEEYTVNGLLKQWPNTNYRMWFLGDWLSPSGSTDDLVNNCAISQCFAVMEKIAEVLDKPDEAREFKQRKEVLNELIHKTYYKSQSKIYGNASQLDLSYPMLAGVTPADLYDSVKQQLINRTAGANKGHIGVGLVGVPILTEWAIQNKAVDYLYGILKKRDQPGYLYMIDKGATTTWESWDASRSRIHNCYNGIGTWFYQAVGGIRPDENNPGYRHVFIEPQIPTGVTWAKTTKETPYGTIGIDWQFNAPAELVLSIAVPVGVTATVVLPNNAQSCSMNGENIIVGNDKTVEVENGNYQLTIGLSGTGISAVKSEINVYPNPFDDYIVLDTTTENQLVICDLSGRTVFSQKTNAGCNRINTSALSQGVYVLKSGDEVKKIIK